jgi:PAS domain S-box-containing protein
MNLLVVTQYLDDVAVLQGYLAQKKRGCKLTTAVNLHQAQTLLSQAHPYNLILTEAELPDGLGQELLPLAQETPLILLSQPGTETAISNALAAGAAAHLIKDPQHAYLNLLPALLEHTSKCTERLVPTLDNHILQQALHNSVIPLMVADAQQANTPIIYVNTSFEKLTGYQSNDCLGRTCLFLHGDDVDQPALTTLHEAIRQGETRSARVRNYRQDGSLFWNDLTLLDIRNEAGELTHFLAIHRDVTRQQEIQAELESNEKRWREVLIALPDLVFRVRGDGTFLDYYTTETELLLVPPKQFVGLTLEDILPSAIAQQAMSHIRQTLQSGQPSTFEYSLAITKERQDFEARIVHYAPDEALVVIREITVARQAQEALQASEERYRSLVESSDALIGMVNHEGELLFVNEYAAKPLGLTAEQVVGQQVDKLFAPDDAAEIVGRVQKVIQTGEGNSFASTIVLGQKQYWYRTSIQPVRDGAGQTVAALFNSIDITAIKEAEMAVRESEQLYRQLFEMHGLPKLIVDPRTAEIVDANMAASEFYGVESANLYHTFLFNWMDLPPEVVLQTLAEAASRNMFRWRSRHQTHGRGVRYVEVFSGPVTIGQNQFLYLILTDITTQIQAQNALKEAFDLLEEKVLARTAELARSEQRYSSLFNQANDAVFLLDLACNHLQVNQRAADMLGYSREEMVGMSMEKVVVPSEKIQSLQVLNRMLAGEKIPPYSRLFRHKTGRHIPVEINVELVRDEAGQPLHIQSVVRDITARQLQERKLRYHASLQQAVTDAVIALDNRNRVQSWNSAAEKLYGYTAVEAFGQDITALLQTMYPPETPAADNAPHKVSVGVGEIIQRDKHGRVLYILSSVSPLYDEFGQWEGLVAVNRDITERKEAEIALREREEQYRVTIETISEGIVQQDRHGRIQLCNAAANRILGLSVEQLMGRTSIDPRWQAIQEDGSPFPGEMHPAMVTLRTGEPQSGVIMGVHQPDGELRWLSVNSEPIFAPAGEGCGEVTAVVTTFTDITNQRQMIETLRQSEQRLELAAQAGGIGVWDWDVQQDILLWDKRMYALYGRPDPEQNKENEQEQEDPSGYRKWTQTLHPDDLTKTLTAIQSALSNQEPYNCEFRILRPDGTVRYIRGLGEVFWQADGKPRRMVGINMDITTRKELEQQLYTALVQERELNELKSRFVSMASHEFRTPLAAILAMTETLSIYRDRLTAAQVDERLGKIRYQVDHLKAIVDDVLQLERIQTGRLKMNPALHDFDELCRNIVAEFESQPVYQGRLQYSFAGDKTGLIAFFDQQLLRQVINNLVHNGLKYSAADQPVYLHLQTTETNLTLTVQDRGIGVPAKDLGHLFEPFHRGANVGVIPGTGLGLSIAQKAVELHQGTLMATSELDEGTTFYLTLPLSGSEDNM